LLFIMPEARNQAWASWAIVKYSLFVGMRFASLAEAVRKSSFAMAFTEVLAKSHLESIS
jgi:hypothetical protein